MYGRFCRDVEVAGWARIRIGDDKAPASTRRHGRAEARQVGNGFGFGYDVSRKHVERNLHAIWAGVSLSMTVMGT